VNMINMDNEPQVVDDDDEDYDEYEQDFGNN
jgi:hypothetical protein